MTVTLITIALIIALWLAGGIKWRTLRIVGVPILLGLVLGLKWGLWIGIASWVVSNSIRLGYGNYEPGEKNCWLGELIKDHNGWWIRAIWGLLVSIAICLPRIIFKHHYSLPYWYIPLNVAVNFGVTRLKLPFWITDPLVAASVSTILI